MTGRLPPHRKLLHVQSTHFIQKVTMRIKPSLSFNLEIFVNTIKQNMFQVQYRIMEEMESFVTITALVDPESGVLLLSI